MKSVENSYALASSVRDLNCRGIHLRWSFSLSLFDQRGSSAESGFPPSRLRRDRRGDRRKWSARENVMFLRDAVHPSERFKPWPRSNRRFIPSDASNTTVLLHRKICGFGVLSCLPGFPSARNSPTRLEKEKVKYQSA